ncbi:methyltransferase domain-containing protein [Halosimplex litoreum]|uniref:Methyltransferase domain-containing protein n=1 Tax=Halosimplex litoreum TaxID=1198301 RepID=A0A7T3G0N0_9EURY|nr:class I SAM-dependent methyltransferase [Halosimplex litoreum]QPV64210.1 methyltransferase domain-containing protein [Halosimplex litoreum]
MSDDHYDALADDWHDYAEAPWRAQILWPTIDELLPNLDGRRVLDAGCGDGTHAAALADRGADVVGVDASDGMIDTARERYGDRDRVEFHRADLAEGLDSLADDDFDLVLCQHVLSHVPDLEAVAAAFARLVRPGGSVVLSTHHPFHEYLVVREESYPDTRAIDGLDARPAVDADADSHPPTYADTERYDLYWGGEVPENASDGHGGADPTTFHRRPLDDLTGPLFDAGFALSGLREPDLTERLDDELAEAVSTLLDRPPRSLCLRAELSE